MVNLDPAIDYLCNMFLKVRQIFRFQVRMCGYHNMSSNELHQRLAGQ